MKCALLTNRFTYHQLPLCESFKDIIDNNFKIILFDKIIKKSINNYPDYNLYTNMIIETYKNEIDFNQGKKFTDESDIAIIGSAPDNFIEKRLSQGKLTFKYSERFYKNGLNIKTLPRAIIGSYLHYGRFSKKPLYLLCASAYTAADVNKFSNFKNKIYKWGYFPKVISYDIDSLFKNKNNAVPELLWCARFIDWKHPEKAVKVAKRLKQEGYKFHLNMIGTGELFEKIKLMIKENNLSKEVSLLGTMSPEKVRNYMEKANLFLFTSDFGEGWGAVLNESMNSACAVVASHAIGSVPFLIKNKENGLIYKDDDFEDLYNKVKFLFNNSQRQKDMGIKAYYTLKNEWNAQVAAERFLLLANEIKNHGECNLFETGPCSKANIIKNDWYKI